MVLSCNRFFIRYFYHKKLLYKACRKKGTRDPVLGLGTHRWDSGPGTHLLEPFTWDPERETYMRT